MFQNQKYLVLCNSRLKSGTWKRLVTLLGVLGILVDHTDMKLYQSSCPASGELEVYRKLFGFEQLVILETHTDFCSSDF